MDPLLATYTVRNVFGALVAGHGRLADTAAAGGSHPRQRVRRVNAVTAVTFRHCSTTSKWIHGSPL